MPVCLSAISIYSFIFIIYPHLDHISHVYVPSIWIYFTYNMPVISCHLPAVRLRCKPVTLGTLWEIWWWFAQAVGWGWAGRRIGKEPVWGCPQDGFLPSNDRTSGRQTNAYSQPEFLDRLWKWGGTFFPSNSFCSALSMLGLSVPISGTSALEWFS